MSKRKKYVPNKKFNPVVMSTKIDRLQQDLIKHQKEIQLISFSYDKHVEYLANFARHDMKNSIQSMDSVLSTVGPADMTEEHVQALKTNIKFIREALDNFSKLVPYSNGRGFTIKGLMNAIELLTRMDTSQKSIKLDVKYPKDSTIKISQPFNALVQVGHNMIINAVKALEMITDDDKVIEIEASFHDDICVVEVRDNGIPILPENKNKIFEYEFTTTAGSGMGLCHAKFLCEKIKGDISVELTPDEYFTKQFSLVFPTFHKSDDLKAE